MLTVLCEETELAMEPRITIITLGVEDVERSVTFYRDGLGLPTDYEQGDFAEFVLQGVTLALYPRKMLAEDATVSPEGSGFSGVTIAHNLPTREGVDQLLAQAERAGGRIVKQPSVASWGGYSGYFADPDGHLWEIAS